MSKEQRMLRVVCYYPRMAPVVATIPDTLEAMQKIVGGYIETLGIGGPYVLVCNEEGKIQGLELNRIVEGAAMRDGICGTFFVCRSNPPEFASIRPEDETRLLAWKPGGTWKGVY